MDASASLSLSPHPSPHGAIGEFPTIAGTGLPPTPARGAFSTHSRSNSQATRPRTPAPGDDLDLSSLIAHAQRQTDLDRSRFGRFGLAPASASVGAAPGGERSPSRWGEDEWSRTSLPRRDASMRRQVSHNSATGGGTGNVTPTPPPFTFSDSAFPSPISRPRPQTLGFGQNSNSGPPLTGPAPNPVASVAAAAAAAFGAVSATTPGDPASAVTHHLTSLTALLNPLIAQSDDLIRLRAEVELWRGEWQRCDRERRRLESVVKAKEDEPLLGPVFTAVLIDGDGLIFQDQHLSQGFAGGQQAARTLVSSLPSLAALTPPPSATAVSPSPVSNRSGDAAAAAIAKDLGNIVIQVFLNKSGLGSALVKAGSVASWSVYDSFWQGFSSAHDLITVIDVGHGKEASDAKIREHLRLYNSSRQCGTIILGATHDNGYASVLSSLETESRLSKLLLLKGYTELAPQLIQYSSRVITVPDLFRATRLPIPAAGPISFSAALANGASAGVPPPSPKSTTGKKRFVARPAGLRSDKDSDLDAEGETDDDDGSLHMIGSIQWGDLDSAPDSAPDSAKSIRGGIPGSAAARAFRQGRGDPATAGAAMGGLARLDIRDVRGPHSTESESGATTDSAGDEDGEWEDGAKKKGRKYKPVLPRQSTVQTVRNLKPRPCHTFYLSPWGCKNGDDCEYSHNYKLNDEQIEELARLAKEIICPYVRSKRCHFSEDECVYGHRCPRGDRCTFGDTCRFKDLPNGHGESD